MSGGGGGMLGPAMADSQFQQGQGGANYSALSPMTPYKSAFGNEKGLAASQMSPFAQQMMQRSMAPNPMVQEAMGLQAALAQMGAQFNQPMMRSQFMPMPAYQNPALNYRPNMAGTQQNLSRVAPSVELQQKQAAEEARIAAEREAAAEQPQYLGNAG